MVPGLIDRIKGKGYKDRLLNPHDAYWDMRIGIQTFGYHPAVGEPGDYDWRVHYSPTPYRDIFRMLKAVDLNDSDTFVDFGAGMGRAVFAASWMGASRAIGVEIVPDLSDKAVKNHSESKLANRDIEFENTNADAYRCCDATVIFMFHPFGEATMQRVIQNLQTERSGKTDGKLRIIYVNPIYDDVLAKTKWLQCFGRLPSPISLTGRRYAASLWRG